jgi:hypothetical protein
MIEIDNAAIEGLSTIDLMALRDYLRVERRTSQLKMKGLKELEKYGKPYDKRQMWELVYINTEATVGIVKVNHELLKRGIKPNQKTIPNEQPAT